MQFFNYLYWYLQKLVNDVFQDLWFQPLKERETAQLLRKVMNITDVVSACKETGYEWFEQLVDNVSADIHN